jgi:hypothetical protein
MYETRVLYPPFSFHGERRGARIVVRGRRRAVRGERMQRPTLVLLTISVLSLAGGSSEAAEPFYAVTQVPAMGTLFSITSADFNADGNLDLATSCEDQAGYFVCLYRGDGTGLFPSMTTMPHAGDFPYFIESCDLDLDTYADIAVVNSREHELGVYLGQADGIFDIYRTTASPLYPTHFAVARLDSGSYEDIVAVSWVYGQVYSFLGRGDGLFDFVSEYDVGGGTTMIAAADFDEDGNTDIVTSNMTYNDLVVMFGNGDGTFDGMLSIDLSYDVFTVAACDLNRDGHEDLVAGTKHTMATLLGDGLGGFALQQVTDYPPPGARAIETADVNEDGNADFAVSLVESGKVRVYRGDGSGSLPTYRTVTTVRRPYGITSGDWNNDGHVDFAISSDTADTLTILINQWEVVSLELSPPENPDVIPGNSLDFTVSATNTQDTTVTADIWLMGSLAVNGREFRVPPGIVEGSANPDTLVLNPGQVADIHYQVRIPADTQPSYYKIMARTGKYANDMMDERSFEGMILE